MPLFQQSVIKKHIESFDAKHIEEKWQLFKGIFHTAEKQQNIRNSKEEQYQSGFLNDLFVKVLGYTLNPDPNFNLLTEQKNVTNSKKADGAIILDGRAIGVIELKGTETTDLNKIEIQAFGYKNNQPGCNYVITSNFEKLRFYIDNTTQQEEFNLFTLTKAQFELLYACLAWESIKSNTPTQILNESVSKENTITKSLYKDYSEFKRALFANLVELNPHFDKLVLFKKTQKLLDRFLFIFFAEDRGLLPTNLIFRINKEWENIIAQRIQVSLYERYKMYFNDLNVGAKVTLPAFGKKTGEAITAEFEIFAYNGGLFVPDEILDNIKIDDTLLHSYTQKMSHYNFESDVDVNILGHIFENSLNEIDEIKSEIEGNVLEKTKTRRKKDGVFYTPKYITKYIVDNTIGKLCSEKKEEMKLLDEDYVGDFGSAAFDSAAFGSAQAPVRTAVKKLPKAKKKALLDKLTDYRNWLLDLTICDPACGSGAFLNQALEFLIAEHRYVDELQAKLLGESMILSDIENSILERNIYGVDLNDESVEIAKLSLWLRTAQKGRKLNSLNNNIKCGNSLIDDPAVAGDKSFSWEKEFPEVFADKISSDGTILKSGGFDVVIGNPPYGAKIEKNDIEFILNKYGKSLGGEIDTYIVFYFASVKLIRKEGVLGFITPDTWLTINRSEGLRSFLYTNCYICDIHDWYKPFVDAKDTRCHSLILKKSDNITDYLCNITIVNSKGSHVDNFNIKSQIFSDFKNWNVYINPIVKKIFEKMHSVSVPLEVNYNLKYGLRTGDNSKYLTYNINDSATKIKIARGSNIERYFFNWNPEYLKIKGDLPNSYFDQNLLESPKIIIQYVRTNSTDPKSRWLEAVIIEDENFIPLNSTSFVYLKNEDRSLKYLLAVLCSELLNFYYKAHYTDVNVKPIYLAKLPIPGLSINGQETFILKVNTLINTRQKLNGIKNKFESFIASKLGLTNPHNKLKNWYELEFSDFIKELNKAIKAAKGIPLTKKDEFEWMDLFEENKKKAQELKSEIDKTDKEIDGMVYELYGLSEEEIKIVEGEN